MNVLKRIALFVFGVAGIVCLATLTLPWLGPWTKWATGMLSVPWYLTMVEACLAITAVGVVVALLRALLTPRKTKSVVVSRGGQDQVTVTTAAISSQAAHIVEADRDFFAEKVTVTARRRGHVRVSMRLRPAHAVNVTEEGRRLQEELTSGLSRLCGDAIDRVELEFVEPDSLDPKPDYLSVPPTPAATAATASPEAAWEPATSGITLPMSSPTDAPQPGEGA